MKILTLRRPWATLLVAPGPARKNVENRRRNIAGDYRGIVAIHSGLEIDSTARIPWATAPIRTEISATFPAGAIIGTVELVDVHVGGARGDRCYPLQSPAGFDWCSTWALADCYHLVTINPRPLATPIPYRGFLGLRDLPDDVATQVLATPTWLPDGDVARVGEPQP